MVDLAVGRRRHRTCPAGVVLPALIAVLLGKVWSPQYSLWLLPGSR